MSTFSERVLEIVKNIPKGQTRSYKQVATLAGSPNAFRAVGTIMRKNKDFNVPCHRVIKDNGQHGQYSGLRGKTKGELLNDER